MKIDVFIMFFAVFSRN